MYLGLIVLTTSEKCMCQFSIPFAGDALSLTKRANGEITRIGGVFRGDANSGIFRAKTPIGSVEGTYEVAGQEISLTISKKPFLLSCKRIEKELRGVIR